jgi:prepilin-type processing-associated H-X9-DG protein
MNLRVTIIGFVLLVLVAAGLVISYIPKARLRANFTASQNNLRELALFAAQHAKPDPKRDAGAFPTVIPPGTVYLADVPPEDRLSWAVDVLPGLDQRKVNGAELLGRIDRTKPWTAEQNQQAGRTRLVVLLCPEHPPDAPADGAAVTSYVGIGGVGPNAAALPLGSPHSGAFRYDGPTPFANVTDGLSQTLLFGETRYEVGPWLRGGVSTVRGLNDAPGAPPLIAEGGAGQFGGYFPTIGANFAFCDGSVHTFSPRTTPAVLLNLATIAGKDTDQMPE